MVKQGKTDSSTKMAIKKANNTAAKARQDLAGAFVTESSEASYDFELDVVDESSTQIPKKPDRIPASSTAPQYSPVKAQGGLKNPPDEVVIPADPTAPPPNQDSADLSIPTIHSRLNYNQTPIKFAYLMDIEDCSSEDELRSHAELLTEKRRRRRRFTRKIKELSAKDESQKSRKPEEKYHRDAINQKTFTSEFTGKESRNMFREDMQTETLTRRNWRELVKVTHHDVELNLLGKYMLLTYDDLADSKQMRPINKISTSRNMYIAIWRTLGPAPKQQIVS